MRLPPGVGLLGASELPSPVAGVEQPLRQSLLATEQPPEQQSCRELTVGFLKALCFCKGKGLKMVEELHDVKRFVRFIARLTQLDWTARLFLPLGAVACLRQPLLPVPGWG